MCWEIFKEEKKITTTTTNKKKKKKKKKKKRIQIIATCINQIFKVNKMFAYINIFDCHLLCKVKIKILNAEWH